MGVQPHATYSSKPVPIQNNNASNSDITKNSVFWDIPLRIPFKVNRRFRRTSRLIYGAEELTKQEAMNA
jgi:hypothetical protein